MFPKRKLIQELKARMKLYDVVSKKIIVDEKFNDAYIEKIKLDINNIHLKLIKRLQQTVKKTPSKRLREKLIRNAKNK